MIVNFGRIDEACIPPPGKEDCYESVMNKIATVVRQVLGSGKVELQQVAGDRNILSFTLLVSSVDEKSIPSVDRARENLQSELPGALRKEVGNLKENLTVQVDVERDQVQEAVERDHMRYIIIGAVGAGGVCFITMLMCYCKTRRKRAFERRKRQHIRSMFDGFEMTSSRGAKWEPSTSELEFAVPEVQIQGAHGQKRGIYTRSFEVQSIHPIRPPVSLAKHPKLNCVHAHGYKATNASSLPTHIFTVTVQQF